MTRVSAPDRRDISGMAGSREPVMDGSSDPAPQHGRITRPMMPRNEEHDPVAARNRLLQTPIDRSPGPVEIHAVQVEHAVGLDHAAAELLVPASVKRLGADGDRLCSRRRYWSRRPGEPESRFVLRLDCSRSGSIRLAGQWSNRGRDPRPQLRLFRAESTHALPCL